MPESSGVPGLPDQAPSFLELIFAHSADAWVLCDAQMRAVKFNPAFAALAGPGARSAPNQALSALLPAWSDQLKEVFERAVQSVGVPSAALPEGEVCAETMLAGGSRAARQVSVYPVRGAADAPMLAVRLREVAGPLLTQDAPVQSGPIQSDILTRRLQALTSALSQALTRDDVQGVVLREAVQATGAYGGTLLSAEGPEVQDGDPMTLIGSVGYAAAIEPIWSTFAAQATYPVVQAIRQQRAVFAAREHLECGSPEFLALLQPGTQAVAAIPMRLGQSVLGLTLSFEHAEGVADAARPFILTVAQQCTQALQRAELYDAERQARQRASFLSEAGRLLAQSLEMPQILQQVTALATEQVADWCVVYLPQETGVLAVAAAAHREAWRVEVLSAYLAQFPSRAEVPYSSAWVFETGQAVYWPTLPAGMLERFSGEQRRLAESLGVSSLISVPLQVRGKTIGVLGLATSSPERPFTNADLDLAQELAQRAAFALDHARLYADSSLNVERYRSLIDASRQVVWTANPQGDHTTPQPGWAALTGQTPEEYAGDGWTRRIHPDDLPAGLAAWTQAVQTRSVYETEQRVQVADGSYRHFHVRAVPILDAEGRLSEWTGVNTDVTERVMAERQLREREGRYRALVEYAAIGILRVSLDQRMLEVNGAAERIFGYSRRDLLRRTLSDLADRLGPQTEAPLGPLPQERRFRRQDGRVVWANVTLSFVTGEQGQALYGVMLIEDITARKQAEREQMRLARVVEESQDFIAFADLDNRLVYLNPAGRALVGLSGEVPPDMTTAAFTHPDDVPLLRSVVWPQVTRVGHWSGEMRFKQLQTGQTLHVHRSIFVLTDSLTNEPLGYATVSRNIDEQKRLDAERLAWQAELERQVLQRTAELQDLNAELDAFSYSVSHDLRAPIRHILGFASLLRRTLGSDAPRAAKPLQVIEQSASRMNVMVDALLELARRGREPLHLGAVDLGALVREVQLDLAPDIQHRQVEWRIGELPLVRGDAVLLRLALFNLLSNALKYSLRQERATVEVYAEPLDNEWAIHVRDNGVGFDPRYAAKLFGVFQRLHAQEEFEGNGVGLANVQRIVTRHGGRIWAVSQVGQGATFSFTLPRQAGEVGQH